MSFISSFSSRFLKADDGDDDFKGNVTAEDQQWVEKYCKEVDEWNAQDVKMFWIRKIKKEEYKRVQRLVVLTAHRLITVAKSGDKYQLKREGHLMDLVKVHEQGLILSLIFRGFQLQFQVGEDTDMLQILSQFYKNYSMIEPGFPPKMACQWLDQYGSSQENDLKKKVAVRSRDLASWETPVRAFESYCSFYRQDKSKLVPALRACLSRELIDKRDDRWIRASEMGITHPRVLSGLLISVAFTERLIHGIEIGDTEGDNYLLDSIILLLRNNGTIKYFVMDGVSTTPEWGSLMYNALQQNQKTALKRFFMKNAHIGAQGVNNFISGLKKLATQPESLALTNTGGSDKQMVALVNSFVGKSEYGKGLVELDLSFNPLGKRGTQALTNRLARDFPNLKVLKVAGCNVEVPRLLSGIEAAQKKGAVQLDELCISHNPCTPQDGLILSRIVANAGCTASLEVAHCGFTGPVVAALVASLLLNDKLEYYVRLDASENNVGTDGAIMIASILQQTDRVMSVKLNDCQMTHEGIGYLLKALEVQPRLRVLELNNNCKRSEWEAGKFLVSQGLRAIVEKALVLESISLRCDPSRGYQYDLDHFLAALRTNSNIVSVDISGNSMTSDNLQGLHQVVIKNEVLQRLYWDENNITARHISSITHALKQNSSLQMVEFPEKDFEIEMKRTGKDKTKKMELQMIRKQFFQALFENNTASGFGFESGPLQVKRSQAKRASIMPSQQKRGGGMDTPAQRMHAMQAMDGGTRLQLPT